MFLLLFQVRFVRLVELSAGDVSASYILHIYIDLTWDVLIHGIAVSNTKMIQMNPSVPRKVTADNAEHLFTSILALKLCPG